MDHPIKRPTYQEHIRHLFTDADAACMRFALDLTTYEGTRASAAKISEWIGRGRMPPPLTGRQWSPEKLQTFRNWSTNTGYAEEALIRIRSTETTRMRKSVHEIHENSDELLLLKKAFEGIIARDHDISDSTSYFRLVGIHWLPGPGTYCRHHDNGYNPWHRAYLIAFEDALRSVDGCESVALPYWDILGDVLPAWVFQPPFATYSYAHEFTTLDGTKTYAAGADTQRDTAEQIHQSVKDNEHNIGAKIVEALGSITWEDFNGWSGHTNLHEGIISAHDNGHGACGETIADQDVAAFDPLFWFFHCNWDRLWWKWQTTRNRTTLLSFKEAVNGDTHWLEEAPDTLLMPFDVNAAEMVDLSEWNIDYEDPPDQPTSIDEILVASRGNVQAQVSFRIPTTERYSVRVKDINRLDIPGSFEIVLYAGDRIVAHTHIFQPKSPRNCTNCMKHGVFSADFIVERQELPSDGSLRIAILIRSKEGLMEEFPLSKAGNPTVNVRILLQTD